MSQNFPITLAKLPRLSYTDVQMPWAQDAQERPAHAPHLTSMQAKTPSTPRKTFAFFAPWREKIISSMPRQSETWSHQV